MSEYNFDTMRRNFRKSRKRAAIRRRKRRQQGGGLSPAIIFKIVLAAVLVIFLLTRATAFFKKEVIEINLTAENAEIYQGEEIPVFTAKVSCEGDTETVLDKETGFKIKDLIKELESETGYNLKCKGDGSEIGEFEIIPELTSAVSTPLNDNWFDKVKVNVVNGVLKVKEHDEEYFAKIEARKNRPMIALTFDDGPGKHTMRLLEALEANDAQATFFMQGINVPKFPEAVAKMKEIGCELGNHSLNHPRLDKLSVENIHKQIDETNQAITAVAGEAATLVRPPYGAVNQQVRDNVPFPLIMWSIDTEDWKTRSTQATIDCVMNNAKDGDIVLMHDIHEATVDAAIQLIGMLKEKGYYLVTVSELAESRGHEMVNGEKYFSFPNNQ